MTPHQQAEKEVEVFAWMKKKGYDRKASKEIAPIIVKYLEDNIKSSSDTILSGAICPDCIHKKKNKLQ